MRSRPYCHLIVEQHEPNTVLKVYMFQALPSLACLASDPMDRSKARACTLETSFDDSSEKRRLRYTSKITKSKGFDNICYLD